MELGDDLTNMMKYDYRYITINNDTINCNCRDKTVPCPLDGRSLTDKLVYKGKLSNRKSNETWKLVQSGDAPPLPLKSTWDFFELGIFLKQNDPLKIFETS